jgi:hypothetical protein
MAEKPEGIRTNPADKSGEVAVLGYRPVVKNGVVMSNPVTERSQLIHFRVDGRPVCCWGSVREKCGIMAQPPPTGAFRLI